MVRIFRKVRTLFVLFYTIVCLQSGRAFGQDEVEPEAPETKMETVVVVVPTYEWSSASYEEAHRGFDSFESTLQTLLPAELQAQQRERLDKESLESSNNTGSLAYEEYARALVTHLLNQKDAAPDELLSAYDRLFNSFMRQQKWKEAVEVADRIQKMAEQVLGPENWKSIDAKLDSDLARRVVDFDPEQTRRFVALQKLSQGYFADVKAIADGVEAAGTLPGGVPRLRVELLVKQGEQLLYGSEPGDRQASLVRLLEALRLSQSTFGGWHPQQAEICSQIASWYQSANEPDKSEQFLLEGLKNVPGNQVITSFGEYDWKVSSLIDAVSTRAGEHLSTRQPQRAKALYDALLPMMRFRHGGNSWQYKRIQSALNRATRMATLDARQMTQLSDISNLQDKAKNLIDTDPREFRSLKLEALTKHVEILGFDAQHHAMEHLSIAETLSSAGQFHSAVPHFESAVQTLQENVGDVDPSAIWQTISSFRQACDSAAQQYLADAKPAEARKIREVEIGLTSQVFGPFHWTVMDQKRRLREQNTEARLDEEGKKVLADAEAASRELQDLLYSQPASIPPEKSPREILRRAAELSKACVRTLGAEHSQSVELAEIMAKEHARQGHVDRAEEQYKRILKTLENSVGVLHPACADTLSELASIARLRGDDQRADDLSLRAAAMYRRMGRIIRYVMEERTRMITLMGASEDVEIQDLRESLKSFTDKGDYLAALAFNHELMGLVKVKFGAEHREYAVSLGNRAGLLTQLGDYVQAEQLFRQAMTIFEAESADGDLDHARNLHNLGVLFEKQRKDEGALKLIEQELKLFEQAQKTETIDYAQSTGTLGSILFALGRKADAEQRHKDALRIVERLADKKHQIYLDNLDNLGFVSIALGKLDAAAESLQAAMDIRKELYGEEHEDYAASSHNLAILHEVRQEPADADALYRTSLDVTWANLEKASLSQSHRQQIAAATAFRRRLNSYLAFTARTKSIAHGDVYQQVLRWKGAAFTRRQQLIGALQDDSLSELSRNLEATTAKLASEALWLPSKKNWANWTTRVGELTERKEMLEQQLFAKYSDARQSVPSMINLEQIQQLLPPKGVLVDIIEYRNVSWGPDGVGERNAKQHLTAFIVPQTGDVQRVDLGPADAIATAVTNWRKHFGLIDTAGGSSGDVLRKLVWEPMEPFLPPGDVIIAPDSSLALFPFAALPGKDSQTYLIEERAIATVPVPQALPGFMKLHQPPNGPSTPASILVVGDVQYEVPAATTESTDERSLSPSTDAIRNWEPLDATFFEMTSVRALFENQFDSGECQMLPQRLATEDSLRQKAPNYRWLHIATHGFFASGLHSHLLSDPNPTSQGRVEEWNLALFHPEVFAGIALAGANKRSYDAQHDGLLTALEVAQMDLSKVDTAVLSACETGLGDLREGEGVLSLQRAFHMAGVQTVISSLWKVNDNATKDLMERFYTNLWRKDMSRIEALRAAQISMLKEGASRGLGGALDEPDIDKKRRLPPYYWASFVLSGDWQ